jgi:hypothetical protein
MEIIQEQHLLNEHPDTNYLHNTNIEIMTKLEKLNEEYNKITEFNYINKDFTDNNEENITGMINGANKFMKNIKIKITELDKIISEYEGYKKDCKELIDGISKLSDIYYKLSTKTQNIDIPIKLNIRQDFIDFKFMTDIITFEKNIDISIEVKREKNKNNIKKFRNFKKLVRKCCTNEDKQFKNNMCSVCVTNKINTCLNPCGHTFCLICVDKMNNKCGMCRGNFTSKIKMFIVDDDDESDNEDNIEGFSGFGNQFPGISLSLNSSQNITTNDVDFLD